MICYSFMEENLIKENLKEAYDRINVVSGLT
jgi:hypothetical protein